MPEMRAREEKREATEQDLWSVTLLRGSSLKNLRSTIVTMLIQEEKTKGGAGYLSWK